MRKLQSKNKRKACELTCHIKNTLRRMTKRFSKQVYNVPIPNLHRFYCLHKLLLLLLGHSA
jgi:hypothetical protein